MALAGLRPLSRAVAARDHILFDYLERETRAAIYTRFRGCSGYVHADAKSFFNLLFASEATLNSSKHEVEHDGNKRVEVGCWYHTRRLPTGGCRRQERRRSQRTDAHRGSVLV